MRRYLRPASLRTFASAPGKPPAQARPSPTPAMPRFSNIAVFCGARPGHDPAYAAAAEALAKEMVKRGTGLVYGGGSAGLMGSISSAVASNGGSVAGFIPADLASVELSGDAVGTTVVVADMHERKARMAAAADAFIAMPGGFGTLEELLEMVTWLQLGYSNKPVGLLNVNGFWNSFLAFIEHAQAVGFIGRRLLVCEECPVKLLDALENFVTPLGFIQAAQAAAANEAPAAADEARV